MGVLFVSGTDTAVGKSTIGAAILAAAVERGMTCAACKPVETGCLVGDGPVPQLVPLDALLLQRAAVGHQRLEDICLFAYEEPCAPAFAAARAGELIRFATIRAHLDRLSRPNGSPDFVLVEGAGGLLVPLGPEGTVATLVQQLGTPMLIVGRAGLGTINHTLLTVSYARSLGIRIAGVVLNMTCAEDTVSTADANAGAIAGELARSGSEPVPMLGIMKFLGESPSLVQLAAAGETCLDLDRLF